jgi:hypothetical protein
VDLEDETLCRLNYVRGDTKAWLLTDEEVEDYGLRLRVLRHSVFLKHCGVGMLVTELLSICRNPKCDYRVARFGSGAGAQ